MGAQTHSKTSHCHVARAAQNTLMSPFRTYQDGLRLVGRSMTSIHMKLRGDLSRTL